MADENTGRMVSFKVDAELGELLDQVPNRSEFIRGAILAQFRKVCPLCAGKGVVPQGVGTHYSQVFDRHRTVVCVGCGAAEEIPGDPAALPPADAPRWEQFLRGGPFHCRRCFEAGAGVGR